MSSYGHIRDLKKKSFSIDIDNDFQPIYEIPDDKKQLVSELKAAAKTAETVWLASDEDREGEAIAWHLFEVLKLKPENTKRIVFHEITKNAILNAIENPRDIDINRVDAQQARRVLDRIVGFELSPVLWKKIKPSLSAGRVQSVAVRLIVEREEEINNFNSEPYFRVTAILETAAGRTIRADLSRRFSDKESAEKFLNDCKAATYSVADVQVKPVTKSPAPPFTTSTLQQEASRKLGFTVSQTMMVAQRLYEAGHITYMRTDSLNLSNLALATISKAINENIGGEYLKQRHYHTRSKGAQEAHEAIRPTYIEHQTIEGTPQEKRLYNLIWKRTIASQMADAQIEKTTVDINISNRDEHFTATGEVIKFDGFLKVYIEGRDDENTEDDGSTTLPKISVGEVLSSKEINATERFTQRPLRYTEAALVKKLEELGIGRPSTYAPTISTIQQREYVEKGDRPGVEREIISMSLVGDKLTESKRVETVGSEKGKLIPTDIGTVVNRFLTQYFPRILDYNFTANVEEKFDEIADGKMSWNSQLKDFYKDFHPEVETAMNMRLEHKVGERQLGVDADGKPVSVKIGRFGPLVQIGTNDGEEKPRFASLLKGQSVDTITLEEALKLFEFPRHLGQFEDKEVTIGMGKFGPYVKHDNKYVSIPKTLVPAEVTLQEAIDLIEAKRQDEKNKIVKVYDENPDVKILNGRYGVYIAYKGSNYKIPKTVTTPADLTLESVLDIIEHQDSKPKRKTTARRSTSTRKK
jgi:DNA topoisomerase-1